LLRAYAEAALMETRHTALDRFRRIAERLELDGWRRRRYSEQPPLARFERFIHERMHDAAVGRVIIQARLQFYDVWIDERGAVQEALSSGQAHQFSNHGADS
jgi:hypothetical protein